VQKSESLLYTRSKITKNAQWKHAAVETLKTSMQDKFLNFSSAYNDTNSPGKMNLGQVLRMLKQGTTNPTHQAYLDKQKYVDQSCDNKVARSWKRQQKRMELQMRASASKLSEVNQIVGLAE
jgi:hypothetical protein